MADYDDLLIGEVLLGDLNNKYLYVGEDQEAQQLMMGSFIRRSTEEGQQVTSVSTSAGSVVVNGTQRFVFVHRDQFECKIKGTSFNRIFVDVRDDSSRDQIKQSTVYHLAHPGGDFV